MTLTFERWPKTPRLFREVVVTEKLDGTNCAVIITEIGPNDEPSELRLAALERDGKYYEVGAQSKNRLIFPGKTTDNYNFAAFVQHNAGQLFEILGPGHHYGEWWGKGIQKRYTGALAGIKGFALFNTDKHAGLHEWLEAPNGDQILVEPVMTLYKGVFSEQKIRDILEGLKKDGSYMSPFDPAEGIVVFHTQSRQVYKVTLDGEDAGKWEQV